MLIYSPNDSSCRQTINSLYTEKPLTDTLANDEDKDKLQYNAGFHQGLHCLLALDKSSGTEMHHSYINLAVTYLKYQYV